MGVIVALLSLAGIALARRQLQETQDAEAARGFGAELSAARELRLLRMTTLADRAASLANLPRIHAALEDDALDLLYLAADDELRDLLDAAPPASPAGAKSGSPASPSAASGRIRFYRFLDAGGRLVPPAPPASPGEADPAELSALAPSRLDREPGYGAVISKAPDGATRATELLALPIHSLQDGRRIGILVLGFAPSPALQAGASAATPAGTDASLSALWVGGHLHAPGLSPSARARLAAELPRLLADPPPSVAEAMPAWQELTLDGRACRVVHQVLNPGQAYPPVHEVRLTPLDGLRARQRAVTWQITAAGLFLLLAGIGVSGLLTAGFSGWFGRFALDSAAQRALRAAAETRLDRTTAELERASRFAADASHQLKTPVAVLRLGLQELAADPAFPGRQRDEVDELVRQTDRLAHILETLLLLAKLDSGLLRPRPGTLDLADFAAAALDDLGALPSAETLALENDLAGPLPVRGESRQLALVLQNLLENAAKYNRPGGLVRLSAETSPDEIRLLVANTAPVPVPPEARERIFERFHRGAAAGDVPGYGLGLNLARHLARLHGGDIRLVRSDEALTVFALALPRG